MSGLSGLSGLSGSSGPSGVSGPSGPSGLSGQVPNPAALQRGVSFGWDRPHLWLSLVKYRDFSAPMCFELGTDLE